MSLAQVICAAQVKGVLLDLLTTRQNLLLLPVVNIGGDNIVQCLMIALVVVVGDKIGDGLP
ncbi:MAG: hypothetical protein AAFQ76_17105 [Cyanobacteria bacterium J06626_26]